MKRCYFLLLLVLAGCRVKESAVHVVEHHYRDSVCVHDTVICERDRQILRLDSAAMAQYGIHLKETEQAWMVKVTEMLRELRRSSVTKTDTVQVRDSIFVPRPEIKTEYVEKEMNWVQRALLYAGGIAIMSVLVYLWVKIRGR
jgi:hypothetical protein